MEIAVNKIYVKSFMIIISWVVLVSCTNMDHETIEYGDGTKAMGRLKKGEKIGKWIFLDSKGDTVQVAKFGEGGLKEGLNSFFADGRIVIEKFYEGGNLKYEKHYHESGMLRSEGPFENNLRQGEWKNYNQQGHLLSRVLMDKGQPVGEVTQYHANGEIQMVGPISGNGIFRMFDTLGRLELKVIAEGGQMTDTLYYRDH